MCCMWSPSYGDSGAQPDHPTAILSQVLGATVDWLFIHDGNYIQLFSWCWHDSVAEIILLLPWPLAQWIRWLSINICHKMQLCIFLFVMIWFDFTSRFNFSVWNNHLADITCHVCFLLPFCGWPPQLHLICLVVTTIMFVLICCR